MFHLSLAASPLIHLREGNVFEMFGVISFGNALSKPFICSFLLLWLQLSIVYILLMWWILRRAECTAAISASGFLANFMHSGSSWIENLWIKTALSLTLSKISLHWIWPLFPANSWLKILKRSVSSIFSFIPSFFFRPTTLYYVFP